MSVPTEMVKVMVRVGLDRHWLVWLYGLCTCEETA